MQLASSQASTRAPERDARGGFPGRWMPWGAASAVPAAVGSATRGSCLPRGTRAGLRLAAAQGPSGGPVPPREPLARWDDHQTTQNLQKLTQHCKALGAHLPVALRLQLSRQPELLDPTPPTRRQPLMSTLCAGCRRQPDAGHLLRHPALWHRLLGQAHQHKDHHPPRQHLCACACPAICWPVPHKGEHHHPRVCRSMCSMRLSTAHSGA